MKVINKAIWALAWLNVIVSMFLGVLGWFMEVPPPSPHALWVTAGLAWYFVAQGLKEEEDEDGSH